MTGAEIQTAIIELAHILGYRVAHFRPARTKHGWRTAVGADGKGFPDLLLVRDKVVAIEVKGDGDSLSPEQREWLESFDRAGVPTLVATSKVWMSGEVESLLR